MKKLTISNNGRLQYTISLSNQGVDEQTIALLKEKFSSFYLLVPENLKSIVLQKFLQNRRDLFPDTTNIIFLKDGEQYKSINETASIYQRLIDLKITRSSCIFILGGGVANDFGGFISATILRGVEFCLFPTTLLAMVDSCLGGKFAVNAQSGKNMIGVFRNPFLVHCNVQYLESLPDIEWQCGFAEMLKHGLITKNINVFKKLPPLSLLKRENKLLIEAIFDSLQVKQEFVMQDPFETKGIRSILNLGHTTAHALESIRQYQLRHGIAVIHGLLTMIYLSAELYGFCQEDIDRIIDIMRRSEFQLYRFSEESNEIYKHLLSDKKNTTPQVPNFVLLKAIGQPITKVVISPSVFHRAWMQHLAIVDSFPHNQRKL